MNNNLKTPILFITFNRLDTTRRVFEEIKKSKPLKLYIASDGPREDVFGEDEKIKEVRNFIESNIDWGCGVKTLFRDKNLGCKLGVSGAIDWFFKNEEKGIILEDDCLPNQSFFKFCEELLVKYEKDERIALISGDNFNKKKIGEADYYFSKIPHIWGWATWRRTWEKYDINMAGFPEFKKNGKIKKIWSKRKYQNYWAYILNETYNNRINSWDYQLSFSLFINNTFCICPNINLVSNIGFGPNFTNTAIKDDRVSNLPICNLIFPLKHQLEVNYNKGSDREANHINLKNFYLKIFFKKIAMFSFIKKIYIYGMSYLRKRRFKEIFHHKVLNKYDVNYFFCDSCGFIQTEKAFWISEAYSSPINVSDTGYVSRNLNLSRRTLILFWFLFGKKHNFLDYAGGYGLFTRLMRDCGLNFFTIDKYTENLFAKGFNYENQKVKAISCFECFEHFEDPVGEINNMLKISKNIFFSTIIFDEKNIPKENWWYYGFEHGQHISFYSLKTLKYIANKNNLFFCSNNKNLHMFLEKKKSNFLFRFLLFLGFLPWDIISKIFLKGKTWSDYEYIKNKQK